MGICVKFKDARVAEPCYFCGSTNNVGYDVNVKQVDGTEKDVNACYSCVQKLLLQNEASFPSGSEACHENMD